MPPSPDRAVQGALLPRSARLSLDLAGAGFRTIIQATGFRPDYRWLEVPVLDRKGQIRHDGNVLAHLHGRVTNAAA